LSTGNDKRTGKQTGPGEAATIEDPRAVLRRYGLQPKHSWGQNFLVNLPLVERIASEMVETEATTALEVGAGLGTLTTALANRMERIVAIERDRDLVAVLREEFAQRKNVEIVEADAVNFDYRAASAAAPTALAGNLPYHLTGRLLRRIIGAHRELRAAVVTVQLEVAERLVARPGGPGYGVLSVMCQAWFDTTLRWKLSPGSFHPPPKVHSAVVRLTPQEQPRAGTLTEDALSRVVHAAFAARRKTLRNSLGAAFPQARVLEALEQQGIDPGLRAETLSVEQFAALATSLSAGHEGDR
jgi:16S rRNA (adenine1518-N6/adenine1519-N6)-dimethyltransferase